MKKTPVIVFFMFVVIAICSAQIENKSPFHTTFKLNSHESLVELNDLSTNDNFKYISLKLNSKNDDPYTRAFPVYVASLLPNAKDVSKWKAKCFQTNQAHLQFNTTTRQYAIELEVHDKRSVLCYDWYLFITEELFFVKFIGLPGKHIIHGQISDKFPSSAQLDFLTSGLRVFQFTESLLPTLVDFWHLYRLFSGRNVSHLSIIDFYKREMNLTFAYRREQTIHLDESILDSGDLIGETDFTDITDALTIFGTGGQLGHVAMILKQGSETFVVESTDPEGIIQTPYTMWINNKERAQHSILLAKLKPELRSKFAIDKAWSFFNSVKGLPYGYNNYYFGWVDTKKDNFPTPKLSPESLGMAASLLDKVKPEIVNTNLVQGLNQRLKYYLKQETDCQTMECVYAALDKLNVTLEELYILPEQDFFIYPKGKALVCSALVTSLYKVAGVLSSDQEVLDSIQATEFTPTDVYQLNIFDTSFKWPSQCQIDSAQYAFCQVRGIYQLTLPQFSTLAPYKYMNQKCGALPMKYIRTPQEC